MFTTNLRFFGVRVTSPMVKVAYTSVFPSPLVLSIEFNTLKLTKYITFFSLGV